LKKITMEIDFAALQEACKKGETAYKSNISNNSTQLKAGIKEECKELKKLYVSLLNTEFKKKVEQGQNYVQFYEPFTAKFLPQEHPGKNVIFLQDVCDEFHPDILYEIENKLDVKHTTFPCYAPNFKLFGLALLKKYF
jgi:hypothetical protein